MSLFNLVEQINVPPGAPFPPQGLLPIEMHAYWQFPLGAPAEDFETRFVMVAETGLETSSGTFRHRAVRGRFRTRTMGLPYPPVLGAYSLRVDWRQHEDQPWHREPVSWPVTLFELERKPRVTH